MKFFFRLYEVLLLYDVVTEKEMVELLRGMDEITEKNY